MDDMTTSLRVSLETPPVPAFAALVQKTVEAAGAQMGLAENDRLRLMLAAEEVFAYLCGSLDRDAVIRCEVADGGWRVGTTLSAEAGSLELGALNVTARPLPRSGEEEELEDLGLLVAARFVDRLRVSREAGRLILTLFKHKHYPKLVPGCAAPPEPFAARPPLRVTPAPAPEQVKEACRLACAAYPHHQIHEALWRPGMLVDMLAAGDMGACLATDAEDRVCGLLCWEASSPTCFMASGPYVFSDHLRRETAEALADSLFQEFARCAATVVILVLATDDAPTDRFEPLGEVNYWNAEGDRQPLPAFYRALRETPGGRVWAHPRLLPFLRREYDRLAFMRSIAMVESLGEHVPARSVFATETRLALAEAVIRPMLDGQDRAQNLADHTSTLKAGGYRNIFFHMDLAEGWQASMAGELMDAGFAPLLLAPDAAKGDLVIFQYVE